MNLEVAPSSGTTPAIRIDGVARHFGDVAALDSLDLEVEKGAVVTLLGPSGSGKTTALRLIAGFDRPDRGKIEIEGEVMVDGSTFVPPEKRRVGMVFQDYALFPHLTVAGNVGYGVAGPKRSPRVSEVLELVGLETKGDRLPHELSGGEQQRVALARALAPDPRVILLDEPFSNLDASLRTQVRGDVVEILRRSGGTAVFVTHDQEEALSMSDSVTVLNAGAVVQTAPPSQLYHTPVDAWVAGFLGDAEFFPGKASDGAVETPVGTFPTDIDGGVNVMIRPEEVDVIIDPRGNGRVRHREFYGHDQVVTIELVDSGTRLRARLGPVPDIEPGESVRVRVRHAVAFPD